MPIAGQLYAKHGTTTPTRLTVIDKHPGPLRSGFNPPLVSVGDHGVVTSIERLMEAIADHVPQRLEVAPREENLIIAASRMARSVSVAQASAVPRRRISAPRPVAQAATAVPPAAIDLVPVAYTAATTDGTVPLPKRSMFPMRCNP